MNGAGNPSAPEGPRPAATVRLQLTDAAQFAHVTSPLHEDLSAVARAGDSLFVACDETASVERLQRSSKRRWGGHTHFGLGTHFDLPDGPGGEMDIEGLAADDGWLWITGSHSLKRDRPKRHSHDHATALERMMEIDRDPNRYFLGRVPLKEEQPGLYAPAARVGTRRPQSIRLRKKSSTLLRWLKDDPHLGPFLTIPSKENGFDIEGLAAMGDRIWLGLRGPVLRGCAVVLELRMKVTKDGVLKARRIDGDRRYRKYLLPGNGLGVRDLRRDGSDMLVLLGPTMSADGPARILRWRDAIHDNVPGVVAEDRVELAAELPYRGPHDHPEGIEHWPDHGEDALLVVYDAPAPHRVEPEAHALSADIFELRAPARK